MGKPKADAGGKGGDAPCAIARRSGLSRVGGHGRSRLGLAHARPTKGREELELIGI